jgi:hypothetical protein
MPPRFAESDAEEAALGWLEQEKATQTVLEQAALFSAVWAAAA